MSDLRSDREPDTRTDAIAPLKAGDTVAPNEHGEDDGGAPENESPDAGISEADNRCGSSDP